MLIPLTKTVMEMQKVTKNKNKMEVEKFELETDEFGYVHFVSVVLDIDLHMSV